MKATIGEKDTEGTELFVDLYDDRRRGTSLVSSFCTFRSEQIRSAAELEENRTVL